MLKYIALVSLAAASRVFPGQALVYDELYTYKLDEF